MTSAGFPLHRLAARVRRGLLTGAAGALALFALCALPAKAPAGTADAGAAVERLFARPGADADWFAPGFLKEVPPAKIDALIAAITADFGTLVAVRIDGRSGVVELERGKVPVTVSLDGKGRIEALWFGPPVARSDARDGLAEQIARAVKGRAALLVRVDGKDLLATDADTPMAVGSAFKLAVLRAYEDAVQSGAVSRDTAVAIETGDRSLPTGVLQNLAPGTPVTLDTLAGLMISISDNTATDILIRVLGRDKVERLSPRNSPFLTTAELFRLAARGASASRAAFAGGDIAQRRAILDQLSGQPLPAISDIGGRATWREAEWFMTGRELCDLLESLREAPALNGAANPLLAGAKSWRWSGFKGGSEFGVLNFSAAGITPDGRAVCAVVTANGDEAQDENRLATLFAGLLGSLTKAAHGDAK